MNLFERGIYLREKVFVESLRNKELQLDELIDYETLKSLEEKLWISPNLSLYEDTKKRMRYLIGRTDRGYMIYLRIKN